MAVLSDTDRRAVNGDLNRDEKTTFAGLTKNDLRAAVNAIDDFFETNAAAINNAIPQPARGAMTVVQKSRLVRYVIQKRYG